MTGRVYDISEIKEIVSSIAQKYGAERIFLFGSYARGEAAADSDIDTGSIVGMFALSGLRMDLLEKLQNKVDLLTTGSLEKDLLDAISKRRKY